MGTRPVAPPAVPALAPIRQRRLNESQRQAVIAAYEAGQSMASLAALYKVKRATISLLLRKADVSIRQKRQMSDGEISQAARLYQSGLSLEQVGVRLGWDDNTIYRHLKKRSVSMRGANDWQH